MATDVIQVQYEKLETIAKQFRRQAEQTSELQRRMKRSVQALQNGGWQGQGASAFFNEMNMLVFPTMQRLIYALEEGHSITLQVSEIMRRAEEEAAAVFRNGAVLVSRNGDVLSAGGDIGGSIAAIKDANQKDDDGGFLGGAGDFFTGMGKEGKDALVGMYTMVRHPVDSAKGIKYAVTHPDEFWKTLKEPYVEAWESGHPWEAVGRGVMFAGTALVGTKGADKASKAAKISRANRVTSDAADIARNFSPSQAAEELGHAGEKSRRAQALSRHIADESTNRAPAPGQNVVPDRVVLGRFAARPEVDFPGYVEWAKTHGGIYYSTSPDVWNIINPKYGNGGAWGPNREFLQSQMERGVERIELRGNTIDEVLNPADARTTKTYTHMEVEYLRKYGKQYGYKQEGDAWVKVGDWRASDLGRAGGASIGPGGVLIEDTQSVNDPTYRGRP